VAPAGTAENGPVDEPFVEVHRKHPLSIRWLHWVHFPLLAILVWSGLCIYWANAEYGVPSSWLDALGLNYQLALGLAWHWPFAVAFTINGLLYAAFLLLTGHWRYLVPLPRDFPRALRVAAHDFHLVGRAPSLEGKYNSAQKTGYFTVFLLGGAMVVTGFAIFKPTQLAWLVRVLGGYTAARRIHFYVTLALMAFFVVHLVQVARAGWNQARAMITGLERVDHEDP
jgi:thiosulfate reductase cytochrome b subunit